MKETSKGELQIRGQAVENRETLTSPLNTNRWCYVNKYPLDMKYIWCSIKK